jgi:hypothetical protein
MLVHEPLMPRLAAMVCACRLSLQDTMREAWAAAALVLGWFRVLGAGHACPRRTLTRRFHAVTLRVDG